MNIMLLNMRQGDPLSPYLFVQSMEVFSILVDKSVVEGFISRYKIAGKNGEEVQITDFLFTDDTCFL